VQQAVNVLDRLGGQPTSTLAAARFKKLGIEEVELRGGQPLEPDLAKHRDDVSPGERGVG
jgi:hypothetical protein